MQTAITQSLALVIAANARLRGIPRAADWPGASVYTFCRDVRFSDIEGDAPEVAPDPNAWLASYLQGKRGARIHRVPRQRADLSERMSVAMIGGGARWLIEVLGPHGSDAWEGAWQVGDRERPDRRIWDVCYYRVVQDAKLPAPSAGTPEQLKPELAETLAGIRAFSEQNGFGFLDNFDRALAALESSAPIALGYHTDLAPPGALSQTAAQLLAAAQYGWVFGGMGSWNDQGADGELGIAYQHWSDRLFEMLNACAVAAANDSFVG